MILWSITACGAPPAQTACGDLTNADCASSARAHYDEGDKGKALVEALDLCSRDSGPGCSMAGGMLADGDGVPKDLERGRTLLQRGCDRGYGESCVVLGRRYEAEDAGRAAQLFRDGCSRGSMNGCRNLAILLATDPATWQESHDLYQKACDGKLLEACVDVEKSYDTAPAAVIRPADADRVGRIVSLCVDDHVVYACSTAARWYSDDKRVPKDMQRVGTYASLACSADEAVMCRNAGLLVANGQFTAPSDQALHFFKEGCGFGDAVSCTHACDLGDATSCAPPK